MYLYQKITTNQSGQRFMDCPNCWGHQEYAGQARESYADQLDANVNQGRSRRKAFVQQFVETNVTGIRLRKEE